MSGNFWIDLTFVRSLQKSYNPHCMWVRIKGVRISEGPLNRERILAMLLPGSDSYNEGTIQSICVYCGGHSFNCCLVISGHCNSDVGC